MSIRVHLFFHVLFIPSLLWSVTLKYSLFKHQTSDQRLLFIADQHRADETDDEAVMLLMQWLRWNNAHLYIEDYDPRCTVLPLSRSPFLRRLNYAACAEKMSIGHLEFRHAWPWSNTRRYVQQHQEVVHHITQQLHDVPINKEMRSKVELIQMLNHPLFSSLYKHNASFFGYACAAYIARVCDKKYELFNPLHTSTLLMDLFMLHKIMHDAHDTLCICAGYNHLERCEPYLSPLGFNRMVTHNASEGVSKKPLEHLGDDAFNRVGAQAIPTRSECRNMPLYQARLRCWRHLVKNKVQFYPRAGIAGLAISCALAASSQLGG